MDSMVRRGEYRAEKIQYPSGIGCCVWHIFEDEDDSCGIAFDFPYDDIDILIETLQELKTIEAIVYSEENK